MHIDRLLGCVILAGGITSGCGGSQAQEAAPQSPDIASATSAPPRAAAPPSTPAEKSAEPGSDAQAICAKWAKPAASHGAPPLEGTLTFAELGPLPRQSSRAFRSARNAKDGAGKGYTMGDLKALAAKAQWQELLQHIEDVPPAKRGAEWDDLLERSATELLTQYGTESSGYSAFSSAERLVERYPALTKSERFMAKRFEVSKLAFQSCLAESYNASECLRSMQDFLKVGSPPPEVAFHFGKLVRGKLNHYLAVPFFHRGLQGRPANAPECADQDLGLAVKAGLGLPPPEENARLAREIAGERCFGTLEKALVAQLVARDSSGYEAENICGVLKAKGAL
jgi:hypothetical protein